MKSRTWFRCILFLYFVMLVYFMFAGFHRYVHSQYRYNLIPFHTISAYVRNLGRDNLIDTAINLVGNVAVFIPLGFLFPASWSRFLSYGRFLLFFIAFIVLLECSQTLGRVGTGDIDDLLLNSVGGSMGYLLFTKWKSNRLKDEMNEPFIYTKTK